MSRLDQFIALPRLIEIDHVDVAAPAERAHDLVRHMDLRRSALVRALLFMRGLPERVMGRTPLDGPLRFDDIARRFGFRVLSDDATGFAAGAERFAPFAPPGWLSVAWQVHCSPLGERAARVTVEVRVTTDDEDAWRRFERAFGLFGPCARLVRRHVLALVVTDLGSPDTLDVRHSVAST